MPGTLRPHSPAQLWSHRMPSPPRIVVPPPALANNGLPDLQVVQHGTSNSEISGFANTEFLKTVTYDNFLKMNAMLEWKYEHRHTAQPVLPFLYLGPSSAAKNEDFLKKEGITMALAVRDTKSARAALLWSKAGETLGLEVKAIDVAGNQELIAAFPEGIEAINSHLSRVYLLSEQGRTPFIGGAMRTGGKVLVFCETGNERSASLVAAYIMAMYSKDLVTTIQIVQAQRFAVAFDDSLRNLLSSYEVILRAKRDVIQHNTQLITGNQTSNGTSYTDDAKNGRKRSIDETAGDDDESMEMNFFNDRINENGNVRREGVAPFQDAS